MKELLRSILRHAGWEIYKTTTRRTLTQTVQHLQTLHFHPSTVIDVGVAHGTEALYQGFPQAKHLLIEPLKEFEPHLKKIAKAYGAEYVLAAAGKEAGFISFHVHKDLSSSSLYAEKDESANGIPRLIDVITLDEVCARKKLSGPFLIKVDVQGAELEVLQGAQSLLQDTEVIILEVSLLPFFEGGPQLAEIVYALKEWGFVVYDIVGGHNRPYDQALAQVDLVFVKTDGSFRNYHHYAARN